MPQEIPVPDAPFSEMDISLSDVSLKFEFYWNEAKQFWSMSISRADGTPVISGFAIMANNCLSWTWGYVIQAFAPDFGAIYCLKTDGTDTPLTRDSFGETAMLVYYTAQEIANSEV